MLFPLHLFFLLLASSSAEAETAVRTFRIDISFLEYYLNLFRSITSTFSALPTFVRILFILSWICTFVYFLLRFLSRKYLRLKKPRNKCYRLPYVVEYSDKDVVLAEQGSKEYDHPGNRKYLDLIGAFCDQYRGSDAEKRRIAENILTIIERDDGRFLKKFELNRYYKMKREDTIKLIMEFLHAFRKNYRGTKKVTPYRKKIISFLIRIYLRLHVEKPTNNRFRKEDILDKFPIIDEDYDNYLDADAEEILALNIGKLNDIERYVDADAEEILGLNIGRLNDIERETDHLLKEDELNQGDGGDGDGGDGDGGDDDGGDEDGSNGDGGGGGEGGGDSNGGDGDGSNGDGGGGGGGGGDGNGGDGDVMDSKKKIRKIMQLLRDEGLIKFSDKSLSSIAPAQLNNLHDQLSLCFFGIDIEGGGDLFIEERTDDPVTSDPTDSPTESPSIHLTNAQVTCTPIIQPTDAPVLTPTNDSILEALDSEPNGEDEEEEDGDEEEESSHDETDSSSCPTLTSLNLLHDQLSVCSFGIDIEGKPFLDSDYRDLFKEERTDDSVTSDPSGLPTESLGIHSTNTQVTNTSVIQQTDASVSTPTNDQTGISTNSLVDPPTNAPVSDAPVTSLTNDPVTSAEREHIVLTESTLPATKKYWGMIEKYQSSISTIVNNAFEKVTSYGIFMGKNGSKMSDDQIKKIIEEHIMRKYIEGDPGDNDVRSERGTGGNEHPGTNYYVNLVQTSCSEYGKYLDNKQKRRIAEGILNDIQQKNGRFLKKDGTNRYYKMEREDTIKKIMQLLRDERNRTLNFLTDLDFGTDSSPCPSLISDESDHEVLRGPLSELDLYEEGERPLSKCCIDGTQQTSKKRIRSSSIHDESIGNINPNMDAGLHSTNEGLPEKKKKKVACKEGKKNCTTVTSIKTKTVVQYFEKPTESDVLFGRGSRSNDHPGNAEYLKFAKSLKEEYKKAKTHMEKKRIVEKVIEFIQSENGKFLKYDQSKKMWFIPEETKIRKKIAKAIKGKDEKSKRKAQTS